MRISIDHPPPLSLYIHIPWCVRKCPYCDFNSHAAKAALPEDQYIAALLDELDTHLPFIKDRPLTSLFFGGGTPSLFSAHAIERILEGITTRLSLEKDIEVTLEANPGTVDQSRFQGFRQAGINRLSLGIQSLQDEKLKALGRIHDAASAMQAITIAKKAGFTNFNLDLMYGLPNQSIAQALQDIKTALSFEPTHFSWYQLTIEPNTLFYHQTPTLPLDDMIWDMQLAGLDHLLRAGFHQYEVSAFATPGRQCNHNRNYWEFGDYLGIGAGAHSKITDTLTGSMIRYAQVRHPKDYLDPIKRQHQTSNRLSESDLIFEFMLNALRLTDGVPSTLFTERTGLPLEQIKPTLVEARKRGLMLDDPTHLCTSTLGKRFLNDVVALFLENA